MPAVPDATPRTDSRPSRTLEVLSDEECWRLLTSERVGRLAVTAGGYPLVFPVNYTVHNRRIVIRTALGTKLAAARYKRISFEVDSLDQVRETGWSVLVRGFGTELQPEHDTDCATIDALARTPWAPGPIDRLLMIAPVAVTGRRIHRRDP